MKSDARWMTKLAGRVLANAIIGGMAFALVGAFCVGLSGGFVGTALDYGGLLGAQGENGFGFPCAFAGAETGALSGIIGAVLFAIATIRAMPGRILAPLNALIGHITWGQIFGTASAFTSFMAFELVKTLINHQGLAPNIFDDLVWILYGAPLLMICGAIAAALTKRDSPKTATLKAE